MTTDSFPLRLDTSTGVIKFIETDSDDLLVLAAKCGQYLADTFDSTAKGRWELKAGTGDDGYVGSIEDTYWPNNTTGTPTSAGFAIQTDTYHVGLVTTQNVNQKSPPSGDALVYPLRYDRTLGGLQEIGDSGGSDPAYTTVQDTILSLIFQHDLPGVYRMAPSITHSGTGFEVPTELTDFASVQAQYLDSDEWSLVLNLDQEFDGPDGAKTAAERVRIYQKTGITAGSATDTLIKSKRPDGGLRLLKRRNIGAIFLGVGVMAGNDENSSNLEIQEFFAGGLLNRLVDNQGQNRPGHFQITTSATPPSGYRNLGKYIDVRKGIIDNGTTGETIGHNGGISTGGYYTGYFAGRIPQREVRAQFYVYPAPNSNRRRRGQVNSRFVRYYGRQFSGSVASTSSVINQYYLHVKI